MTVLYLAVQHTGTSCMQHSQTAGVQTLNFSSLISDLPLTTQ